MSTSPPVSAGPDPLQGCGAAPFARLETGAPAGLRDAVRRALAPRCPADRSNLTASGAPIEAGFVWPGAELRLTVDPDPLASARMRLAACRDAAGNILAPSQRAVAARLATRQRRQGARWGAWLGLRAAKGGIRRKLYLEVPPAPPRGDDETAALTPASLVAERAIVPAMVGLDGSRGGIEVYGRCRGLYPTELDTLLAHAGMERRGVEIVRTIEALTGRTIRGELPSADMGFSVARGEDGGPLAFTWYSTSRALLGPPGRARAAVLRVGLAAGWDLRGYARLTAGAATPHHGVIGVTIPVHGPLQLTASVALFPPEESGDGDD